MNKRFIYVLAVIFFLSNFASAFYSVQSSEVLATTGDTELVRYLSFENNSTEDSIVFDLVVNYSDDYEYSDVQITSSRFQLSDLVSGDGFFNFSNYISNESYFLSADGSNSTIPSLCLSQSILQLHRYWTTNICPPGTYCTQYYYSATDCFNGTEFIGFSASSTSSFWIVEDHINDDSIILYNKTLEKGNIYSTDDLIDYVRNMSENCSCVGCYEEDNSCNVPFYFSFSDYSELFYNISLDMYEINSWNNLVLVTSTPGSFGDIVNEIKAGGSFSDVAAVYNPLAIDKLNYDWGNLLSSNTSFFWNNFVTYLETFLLFIFQQPAAMIPNGGLI